MTEHGQSEWRVLVCGGRDYRNRDYLRAKLDELHSEAPITTLIHGNAPGADTLAGEWALERGIHVKAYQAEWEKYGKAAGPMRNKRMLEHAFPDLVVAFPGGRGTANMIEQARKYGVAVQVFQEVASAAP